MQPVYAIVRLDDDCFRLASICPAPMWQSLRVLAYVGPHWCSPAAAREAADGRVLPSVWTVGGDGLARTGSDVDPAGALRARWQRPRPATTGAATPAPRGLPSRRDGAH